MKAFSSSYENKQQDISSEFSDFCYDFSGYFRQIFTVEIIEIFLIVPAVIWFDNIYSIILVSCSHISGKIVENILIKVNSYVGLFPALYFFRDT